MGMNCDVYRVPAETVQRLADESGGLIEIMSDLEGPDDALSLEKSWHGLHFVLTGTAEAGSPPLDFLVAGGQSLDGQGAERLIAPADVRSIAAAFENISAQEFAGRFDLAAMDEAGVYPRIWDEPLEDLLGEYFDYFKELKSLVQRAAASNSGLLLTMG